MKLTNEIKNEIIKDYNEKMKPLDIVSKYNISKATYYRIIKESSNVSKNNTIINNEDESTENESNENESNENENESNNVSLFNKEQFKKELNDNDNDNNDDNDNDNNDNNISVISKKSIKVNKVFKNTPTIIKNDVSDLSISFNNRKNHYSNVNKSNIMETIKQVNNSESVDELKEKRSLIIIIRSYINTFEK